MYQNKSLLPPINQKLISRKLDACLIPQITSSRIYPRDLASGDSVFPQHPRGGGELQAKQAGLHTAPWWSCARASTGIGPEPALELDRGQRDLAGIDAWLRSPNYHTKSPQCPFILRPLPSREGISSFAIFFPHYFLFPPLTHLSSSQSLSFPSRPSLSLNSWTFFLFLSLSPFFNSTLSLRPSSSPFSLGIQDRRGGNLTCILYAWYYAETGKGSNGRIKRDQEQRCCH